MTRVALAAVVGTVVLFAASAAGAPRWDVPLQLSTGERALGPELAMNASGAALAVWDQEVGAECAASPASLHCLHAVTAVDRPVGARTWSAPTEISRPGVGAAPGVALDPSGNAAILWIHDIGRDRVVQATYRRGPSGTWPEPNDISEASLEVRNHDIALDRAGNAVAVWAERRDQVFDVYAAVRLEASGVWAAPVRLSGALHAVSGPDLALTPAGQAAVAWIDGSNVLRVVGGNVASNSWEPPASPAGSGGLPKRSPRVAVNTAGDMVVVWLTGEPGTADRRIWDARRRDGEWQPARPLELARSSALAPALVLDEGGTATAAWLSPRGLFTATRTRSSSDWTHRIATKESTASSDPYLAVDVAGNVVLVWVDGAAGGIRAALAPGPSVAWQRSAVVTPAGASAAPVVRMGARGRAILVWNRNASGRVVVEGADLAGDGPVLAEFAIPPRALVAGAVGRFSVSPLPWSASLVGEPHWNFGDGSDGSGKRVAHSFARVGAYTVTVSHTDVEGGVSTASAEVRVVRERVRNLRRPRIQGVPRVGRTLKCLRGSWTGSPPIRFAYAWRRDGQLVASTRPRYHLVRDDLGSLIACEVVATNPAGSARATSNLVGVER